jgi:hypothetical protein
MSRLPLSIRNGNRKQILHIPLVGSGTLRFTGAEPYDERLPQGTPCDEEHTVPESAVTTGTARFFTGSRAGQQVPFTLDLDSTICYRRSRRARRECDRIRGFSVA